MKINRIKYIDAKGLIDEVRHRPVLWNPTHSGYKVKSETTDSWIQVATNLFGDTFLKKRSEREKILQDVATKWRTVRDNYVRYLKALDSEGGAQRKVKRYKHADELNFLDDTLLLRAAGKIPKKRQSLKQTANSIKEEGDEGMDNSNESVGASASSTDAVMHAAAVASALPNAIDSLSNECEYNDVEIEYEMEELTDDNRIEVDDGGEEMVTNKIDINKKFDVKRPYAEFVECSKGKSRIIEVDDDLAFFYSLLPTVKTLSADEKMDFRLQTMQTLKGIRLARTDDDQLQEVVVASGYVAEFLR